MISQILFALCLGEAVYFAIQSVKRIYANISLGKDYAVNDHSSLRLKQMLLVAFGQKKMFDRPIPALLHLFVYVGFLVVNIEMLEIVLDGLVGTHRIFEPILGSFYFFLINVFEFFAVAVLLACVVFIIRRNVLKIKRFWLKEMTSAPRNDATIILVTEILLMSAFLTMNAADMVLHKELADKFIFSSFLVPIFAHLPKMLVLDIEVAAWWFHILGVFAFANYLPYSKHLHIILAFPNTYYSKLKPLGFIKNMPEVTKEVKSMLSIPLNETESSIPDLPGRFGAKDVQDLTWKQLMEAYTCTECGRCSSVCPANLTGKKLSPRKIMMDTRDRLEEKGKSLAQNGENFDDGKSLLGDYISAEELLACTTCNACADACPINIDPVSIIIDLRRFMIMEESKAPQSWNGMFSNLENNMAPWKFSPSDRFNWSEKL